jgi:hypothetical protein
MSKVVSSYLKEVIWLGHKATRPQIVFHFLVLSNCPGVNVFCTRYNSIRFKIPVVDKKFDIKPLTLLIHQTDQLAVQQFQPTQIKSSVKRVEYLTIKIFVND